VWVTNILSARALSQAAIPMDIETAKKLTATLKKYPDEYSKLKMAVQMMIDQLSQLITE
jgi:methyl-accepting chemotaxis protein